MNKPAESLEAKVLSALQRSDEASRPRRVKRIAWLSGHQVAVNSIGPVDTMAVLDEAKDCFVYGHYIATLLLAVAFIEHTLADELEERNLGSGHMFRH